MSRIAKIPVILPNQIKTTISSGSVHMDGTKGKVEIKIPDRISVEQKGNALIVNRHADDKQSRADHGTTRAHLANMVEGVMVGHKKELEIQGIGFRAQLQGNKIVFNLGLSHPVEFDIPSDVQIKIPTQTSISIEGVNNARVGQIAASIRSLKPVEPYKGKGIRYVGESVRRKQGKSVTK